jgi:hypothetical protein
MCVAGLDVLHVVGGGGEGGCAVLACGLRCLDLFLATLAVDVREPE